MLDGRSNEQICSLKLLRTSSPVHDMMASEMERLWAEQDKYSNLLETAEAE